ncbi:MAG: hypothetical protein PUE18_10045 [Firmicutes bacterium]|nr:hypothetical protein [Bacillota bacterium]
MQDKKKIYLILGIIIIISFVAELLFAHPHYHMIWNIIPGADVIIGFLGAWILIFIAKIVIANLLQRRENYYEEGSDQDA